MSSAIQLVFEFPDQRLENLVARSNGHLLLAVVSEAFIMILDRTASDPSLDLLHQFLGFASMAGLADTAPDIFAVVAENSGLTMLGVPGLFSVWSVNLNTPEPTVKLITSIPAGAALNGLTTLDGSPDIILIADSTLGAVLRVNVTTRDYSMAIQASLFKYTSTSPREINGARTSEEMLYLTNSALGSYGRVPIINDSCRLEILGTSRAHMMISTLIFGWKSDLARLKYSLY